MTKHLVLVGSTNPVKVNSVQLGFNKIWPDQAWQALGVGVPSSVSDQPMSPKESFTGAKERAKQALLHDPEAEYGVGLEGGVELVDGLWFDCGWCVILNRQGEMGVATSARIQTPDSIMQHLHQGKELGDAIDIIFNRKNAKQAEGQFGLMTDGAITRTDGYVQAVCLALSRFLHPELF